MAEPNWGLLLVDILKYTLPALIVFLTVYFLGKQFFTHQQNQKLVDDRLQYRDASMNIKLQAYERLVLFCDRMDVVNLAMRLTGKDLTANDLKQAMMISIQKEYEHNLAQQIYVSDKLWQIISQAKSGTINLISTAYGALPTDASAQDLLREITKKMQEINLNPATTATSAIRSEASQLFNL